MDILWRNVISCMDILLALQQQKRHTRSSNSGWLIKYLLSPPLKTKLNGAMQALEVSPKSQQYSMLSADDIIDAQVDSPSASYTTGTCLVVSVDPVFSSPTTWIVHSGAFRQICANAREFITMKPLHESTVTLPNKTSVPIYFIGAVTINYQLIFQDVIFVLQFTFNLLSVGALTTTSQLTFTFFPDHLII